MAAKTASARAGCHRAEDRDLLLGPHRHSAVQAHLAGLPAPAWRRSLHMASGIPPICSSAIFSNFARLFSRATQIGSTTSRLPWSHDTERKAPETRRAHLPVSLCETDVRRAAPGVKATRACTAAADSREGATRDFRSLTAAPPNSLDFAARLDLARSFAARVTAGELLYTLALRAGAVEGGGQAGHPQAANERWRGAIPTSRNTAHGRAQWGAGSEGRSTHHVTPTPCPSPTVHPAACRDRRPGQEKFRRAMRA